MMNLRAASLVLLSLLLAASSASADRGVGISVGNISVTEALAQGGTYRLPDFAVINTGDESGMYQVSISPLGRQSQRRPDPDWFEFQPPRFYLEPGQTQDVSVRLLLPSGVDTGSYYTQIQAEPLTEGAGETIGVAAATRLTFTVEPSSWLSAQRLRISRFLRDIEPWSYVVEGLILAGAIAYLARRYSPVRLRNPFERRR